MDKNQSSKLIIQLLPSLIRDAGENIFTLFCERILPKLVERISIQKIEELEIIYTAIAYSLKFLFRSIEKNLERFYLVFQEQLFQQRNLTIQRFSSEAFSYIFKKLKKVDVPRSIEIILKPLLNTSASQELIQNISNLLFEFLKGTVNSFARKSDLILRTLT